MYIGIYVWEQTGDVTAVSREHTGQCICLCTDTFLQAAFHLGRFYRRRATKEYLCVCLPTGDTTAWDTVNIPVCISLAFHPAAEREIWRLGTRFTPSSPQLFKTLVLHLTPQPAADSLQPTKNPSSCLESPAGQSTRQEQIEPFPHPTAQSRVG